MGGDARTVLASSPLLPCFYVLRIAFWRIDTLAYTLFVAVDYDHTRYYWYYPAFGLNTGYLQPNYILLPHRPL